MKNQVKVEVPHEQPCPYPFKLMTGQTIVDELCYCGHRRSHHHDTLAYGHGDCHHQPCGCKKYTFKKFVFKVTVR